MKSEKNSKSECIKVIIRCRPFTNKEKEDNRTNVVSVSHERGELSVVKVGTGEEPKVFTFDNVYGQDSQQEIIYQENAYPIVEFVLEGYNGTVFAYGQTGTGKTYTMEGKDDSEEHKGIMPRAFATVFHAIEGDPNKQYLVRASYLEIYKEEIRDLLSKNPKNKLELKEKPQMCQQKR